MIKIFDADTLEYVYVSSGYQSINPNKEIFECRDCGNIWMQNLIEGQIDV